MPSPCHTSQDRASARLALTDLQPTYHIDRLGRVGMMPLMDDPAPQNVAAMRPRASSLEKRIREIALDSAKVGLGVHARERMVERDITDRMVFEVLRTGTIKGGIDPGSNPGEWKCKMVKAMKGRRDVGVVTIIVRNERLLVKTAEWEDLR